MPRRSINWLAVLSKFVRDHPKTSAAVAFNLGMLAAGATKRAKGAAGNITDISAKVIELVPSMKDISEYVPLLSQTKKPGRPRSKKRGTARRPRKAAKTRSSARS